MPPALDYSGTSVYFSCDSYHVVYCKQLDNRVLVYCMHLPNLQPHLLLTLDDLPREIELVQGIVVVHGYYGDLCAYRLSALLAQEGAPALWRVPLASLFDVFESHILYQCGGEAKLVHATLGTGASVNTYFVYAHTAFACEHGLMYYPRDSWEAIFCRWGDAPGMEVAMPAHYFERNNPYVVSNFQPPFDPLYGCRQYRHDPGSTSRYLKGSLGGRFNVLKEGGTIMDCKATERRLGVNVSLLVSAGLSGELCRWIERLAHT